MQSNPTGGPIGATALAFHFAVAARPLPPCMQVAGCLAACPPCERFAPHHGSCAHPRLARSACYSTASVRRGGKRQAQRRAAGLQVVAVAIGWCCNDRRRGYNLGCTLGSRRRASGAWFGHLAQSPLTPQLSPRPSRLVSRSASPLRAEQLVIELDRAEPH